MTTADPARTTASIEQPGAFQRAMILATATLATMLVSMTLLIVSVVMPQLQGSLSATQDQVAWVITFNIIAIAVVTPMTGWLANRFGRKSVLVGCSLVLAAVSGFMCWFADSMTLPVLYLMFFCLFLTGGPVGPVVAAVSKELFPISISGTSVGTVNLFPFMGGAIFQVIIGAVLTAGSNAQGTYALIGFRYMFLICLGAALVSLVASFFMKETLSEAKT